MIFHLNQSKALGSMSYGTFCFLLCVFKSFSNSFQFNGNNAGGRKRKVEPHNISALAMNSWSNSQRVTVTTITYTKYRMSHQRHCSRKHGSTRENKPTTTKSLIIKKSNRVVFKGSQKTFNKRMGKF